MRYLLDTDIVSAMMKNPAGPVAERIRNVGEGAVLTSIIVASELRFGVEKVRSGKLAQRLDALLSELTVEPLEPPADERYASLRAALERAGQPIGQNDMRIASHAIALNAILVTDNENQFSRIPGLKTENWLRMK